MKTSTRYVPLWMAAYLFGCTLAQEPQAQEITPTAPSVVPPNVPSSQTETGARPWHDGYAIGNIVYGGDPDDPRRRARTVEGDEHAFFEICRSVHTFTRTPVRYRRNGTTCTDVEPRTSDAFHIGYGCINDVCLGMTSTELAQQQHVEIAQGRTDIRHPVMAGPLMIHLSHRGEVSSMSLVKAPDVEVVFLDPHTPHCRDGLRGYAAFREETILGPCRRGRCDIVGTRALLSNSDSLWASRNLTFCRRSEHGVGEGFESHYAYRLQTTPAIVGVVGARGRDTEEPELRQMLIARLLRGEVQRPSASGGISDEPLASRRSMSA